MARTTSTEMKKPRKGVSRKKGPASAKTGKRSQLKRESASSKNRIDRRKKSAQKKDERRSVRDQHPERKEVQKARKRKKTREKGPSLFTRAIRAVVRGIGFVCEKIRHFLTFRNTMITLIVLCVFFILFQIASIYALSNKVSDLQNTLTTVEGEVDSKEGRLISSSDIKEVEKSAREYGMTEAKPSQYIYETYSQKNLNTGVTPGLYDYLAMFREVREGYLWPNN